MKETSPISKMISEASESIWQGMGEERDRDAELREDAAREPDEDPRDRHRHHDRYRSHVPVCHA